jgi:hypothetical protein
MPEDVHHRDLMEHHGERTGDAPGGADVAGEQLRLCRLDGRDGGGAVLLELCQQVGRRDVGALRHPWQEPPPRPAVTEKGLYVLYALSTRAL